MDDTTLKVAMAAFFHDMGKFVDPETLDLPEGYKDNNAGSFLPSYQSSYSHWHALYTAAFIEQMEEFMPVQCNAGSWGRGDSFIRLAAAHHAPSSAMEYIITLADRISSGMDREEFNKEGKSIHYSDYKKTRLFPVFEHLSVEDDRTSSLKADQNKFQYPLMAQSPESIFPGEKTQTNKSRQTAQQAYKKLFRDFLKNFKLLAHKDINKELWFEHFDSLMQCFTSAIPAARVGRVIPDVSLYDHLKTTSAIATAIYKFHEADDTLNEKNINNRDEKKFMMISGSFNGIQNYIFSSHGDSRKYRSKLLRGRSFSVSLLSELTSDMLCRELSLPHTSIILNAGGRFTVLASNTEQTSEKIKKVENTINAWLIKQTFGEASLSISNVKAACADFESKNFSRLWDKIVISQDSKKFSKIDLDSYGGAVEDYLDSFSNRLTPSVCPLCGKRPAEENTMTGELHTCSLCSDHVFLGENLVKEKYIAITHDDTSVKDRKLKSALFGKYQLFFPKKDPDTIIEADKIIKYWNLGKRESDNAFQIVTDKYISGYVPVYPSSGAWKENDEAGNPKTLNDIAASASIQENSRTKKGIEALGVLKADVDNLGLLMSCGLRDNLYTVSRMATLSRQMNNFFALYLPHLLENEPEFKDVYTVFAGGDDLFLIGPWNKIMLLAAALEEKFRMYVCHNREIHFSVGITMHKAHTPVDHIAGTSELSLKESKNRGRNRITAFFQTVTWQKFYELEKIKNELEQWIDDEWISSVFLYKLNYFIDMVQAEKKAVKESSQGIPIENMACTKWRSLLIYALERNAALKSSRDIRQERVKYIGSKIALWLDTFGSTLRIPLWTIQYNQR